MLLLRLHTVPVLSHVYPNGQQLPPHVGRLPPRLVVITDVSWLLVMFCSATSQLIAWMLVQSEPCGQQSAEEEESVDMQNWFGEQQKLPGSFESMEEQEV